VSVETPSATEVTIAAKDISSVARFMIPTVLAAGGPTELTLNLASSLQLAERVVANSTNYMWLYHSSTNSWMPRLQSKVACYVVSWHGTSIGIGHSVTFRAPPWQGNVGVRVKASERSSINALSASYAIPAIQQISPKNGSTLNEIVRINGNNFGVAISLLDVWQRFVDPSFNTAGANLIDVSLFRNTVVFKYIGLIEDGRECRILSWTDTTIWCVVPEGVPEALATIIISLVHKDGVSVSTSTDVTTFTYNTFFISSVVPAHGPTSGGYPITLYGNNLARFLVSAPAVANATSAPQPSTVAWAGSTYLVNATDGSAVSKWSMVVLVKGVPGYGLVSGQSDSSQLTIPVEVHTHNQIRFIMPPVEGHISITLVFLSQSGSKTSQGNVIRFTADPPTITSINAEEAGGHYDADPCAALL
jgi:hypothetical protein